MTNANEPQLTWWLNDGLVAANQATVPIADHGLTVGDGCFETTTVVRGEAFALRRHIDRLRHSLSGLRLSLPMSDDELRLAVEHTIAANHDPGVVRITVTAGRGPLGSGRLDSAPTLMIAVGPARRWDSTAAVITVPWPRNERGAMAGIKSTSYAENVVALVEAHGAGASEAIFANTVGHLCEGTGTNIFVEHEGRLVTPPLSAGCLAGVTRALVIETSDVTEVDLPVDVLALTSEAFLTSSTRDVMAIDKIDDRPLAVGPLTTGAASALAALVARTTDP